MKTTVTRQKFHQAFADAKRTDNFSSEGLDALFDYLEWLEANCNTEIELNVVALCSEYVESTVGRIAKDYSIDLSDCEDDAAKTKAVRDFLDDYTRVVGETSDGFVYACFLGLYTEPADPAKEEITMTTIVNSQTPAAYSVGNKPERSEEDAIIAHAKAILESRLRKAGDEFTSPKSVMDFLSLRLAHLEHEVFAVMFLDSQHRLLAMEEMFRGTLTQASVHPREVVKRALALNAGAVVLSHNHPSGVAEPSRADERITATLRDALKLVDVRVLDHVIVGHGHCVSMAEKGLI